MKPISKADLYKKTNRELAGLQEEFRKSIGHCDQQRRKAYAAQADIKTVQRQRKNTPAEPLIRPYRRRPPRPPAI